MLTRRFGNDAVYSPTVLEAYADCPFSLYLGDVLSLEPLASPDPDLTARERGSLVHRIAHRFYAGWRRDGHGPLTDENHPEALRRILAIGREEAEQVSLRSPAWAVEKEFLLGSPLAGRGLLERFIENELRLAASPSPGRLSSRSGSRLRGQPTQFRYGSAKDRRRRSCSGAGSTDRRRSPTGRS